MTATSTHSFRRAFTMVELMVVVVIIVVLISSVMVASTTLIERARASNTEAMLGVVTQAIEEFKREQESNLTAARSKSYRTRYGLYPPDELEALTAVGVPGGPGWSIAPGRAQMIPAVPGREGYDAMNFFTAGLALEDQLLEHRDQVAMTTTILVLGDASSSILLGIQDKFWKHAPLDPQNDEPAIFLDRNGDGNWDAGDLAVRYLVDSWGTPISYLAQRDWTGDDTAAESPNLETWNEASTEIVRLNRNRPVLFSYGPDGPEQLTEEHMDKTGIASLVGDFEGLGENDIRHRIDNPLNADNVYADPTLKEKLAKEPELTP